MSLTISTRNRAKGHGKTYVKTQRKIPINLDLSSLNLICNYVLTENRNIKRMHFVNLRNFMEMLDMEKFSNDQEKYKRIVFIKRGIEARLDKNLQDRMLIMTYINGGILDNDMLDMSNITDMSNFEIDYVTETISNGIKYAFIYESADYILDLFTRFKSADYQSIGQVSEEIEQAIATLNTQFRKAKVETSSDRTFSLTDETLKAVVVDAWNEVTSSYRKLTTGMQGFNQLIGGGFENTRVYLLLGLTGVGKSMTLVNLAYQLKKYNKGYKTKDPTKRPCIVYLTMENTVVETIQRLFQICTGEEFAKQNSPEEALEKMRVEGELYLTDESPIDIIIKFKPNKSEDTSYLYTLVEDLEDEGYETIALLQDHAKRIRSTERNPDVRLELGDVINEFKTFAMIKDIPVISNSHLNRDGARVIDSNAGKSKADLTRLLGKSNIGESLLMLDNVDFACIINNEYDNENRKWMIFKQIKTRIKVMRDYICQPFDLENDIKLIEDYYSPVPVFKESLYEAPIMNMGGASGNKSNMPYMKPNNERYISNIPVDDDDDQNIYELSTLYSQPESLSEEKEKVLVKPFIINAV
jgi:hypothetical protein